MKTSVILFEKLTPSGNFTNVLRAAFMCVDPKSELKLLNLTIFFAILGSARVKAARRTMVKLTPSGNKNRKKINERQKIKQNVKRDREKKETKCVTNDVRLDCLFTHPFLACDYIFLFPLNNVYSNKLSSSNTKTHILVLNLDKTVFFLVILESPLIFWSTNSQN